MYFHCVIIHNILTMSLNTGRCNIPIIPGCYSVSSIIRTICDSTRVCFFTPQTNKVKCDDPVEIAIVNLYFELNCTLTAYTGTVSSFDSHPSVQIVDSCI